MTQHDYQEAGQSYFASVMLDPTFAFGWNGLAQTQLYTQRPLRARTYWEKAISNKPDFVEAQMGLALLDLNELRYSEAKKHIDAALNVVPNNVNAIALLAYFKAKLGQTDEALQIVNRIERIRAQENADVGKFAQLILGLARAEAWMHSGHSAEALEYLKRFDTKSIDKLDLKAYYLLEMACAVDLEDFEQAQHYLSEAENTCPKDIDVFNAVVSLALAQQDRSGAQGALADVKGRRGKDCQSAFNQALFDYLFDKREQARKELKELIELPDLDAFVLVKAAYLLHDLGEQASARKAALRVLSIDKDNQAALAIVLSR
jgi:tetratricopeptide (TPR) repeat protein